MTDILAHAPKPQLPFSPTPKSKPGDDGNGKWNISTLRDQRLFVRMCVRACVCVCVCVPFASVPCRQGGLTTGIIDERQDPLLHSERSRDLWDLQCQKVFMCVSARTSVCNVHIASIQIKTLAWKTCSDMEMLAKLESREKAFHL